MKQGPPVLLASLDDRHAQERGRLLAATALSNPEQRKLVEDELTRRFGGDRGSALAYLKDRYPEVYKTAWPFRNILDKLRLLW